MALFTFRTHPHAEARKTGPPKTTDQLAGFNARLALRITGAVGTMRCAYIFTAIALISLPAALRSGNTIVIVSWIAQTFLQLVLLSIIIVGQNIQAAAADRRSQATYEDADLILHHCLELERHLQAQDDAIMKIVSPA